MLVDNLEFEGYRDRGVIRGNTRLRPSSSKRSGW